jgi:hypothetical protein
MEELGELWDNLPTYMKPPTYEQALKDRNRNFQLAFSDKQRKARGVERSWKTQIAFRETEENHLLGPGIAEWHIVCSECNRSIIRIYSNGQPFNFDVFMTESMTINHLYRFHQDELGMSDEDERGQNLGSGQDADSSGSLSGNVSSDSIAY